VLKQTIALNYQNTIPALAGTVEYKLHALLSLKKTSRQLNVSVKRFGNKLFIACALQGNTFIFSFHKVLSITSNKYLCHKKYLFKKIRQPFF